MAKVTNNQQVVRAVNFLMGLRDPRVHQALVPYGLTTQVLEEGQRLLRGATMPRLASNHPPAMDPRLVQSLDEFENLWFPIIKAVLSRHFTDVGEWLFNNLARTQGADLVVSLDTLLQRLRELERGTSQFKKRGKGALELLNARGFSKAAQEEGERLIARVTEFEQSRVVPLDTEAEAKSVAALWAWYLEWSSIVRAVIKDRRVLRRLGFLQRRTSDTATPEVDTDADTEIDNASANPGGSLRIAS